MIRCPRCGSYEYTIGGTILRCKLCKTFIQNVDYNGGISSPPKLTKKPAKKEERAVSDENGELVGFIEVAVGCHTLPAELEVCGVTYKR